MATAKSALQARTLLRNLGNLPASYVNSMGTLTFNTNQNLDCKLEITATAPSSGNVGITIYAQQSMDGFVFETGPSGGPTLTDLPNLTYVGYLPLPTASATETRIVDLAAAFGGTLPYACNIILCNNSTNTATGVVAYYSEVQFTVA